MATQKKTNNIILGLDPGTRIMGYGVLQVQGADLQALQYGIIRLDKWDSHARRLRTIFRRVLGIIDEYHPDEIALEAPFYGNNVQSMLKLGRAQGVAMAAALHRDAPIFEYAPRRIKQSVVGRGAASKEQVAKMLAAILGIDAAPSYLDATDALAVAVCHHYQQGMGRKKKTTWSSFVTTHPHRVKH